VFTSQWINCMIYSHSSSQWLKMILSAALLSTDKYNQTLVLEHTETAVNYITYFTCTAAIVDRQEAVLTTAVRTSR